MVNGVSRLLGLIGVCTSAFLAGCAAPIAQIGSYHNNGDQAPLIYSSHLLANDFKNLSDGEAVALAAGSDKAIARPNLTEIHVYKKIQKTSQNSAMDLRICDPDGDGVLDIFCPAKQQIADAEKTKYFDLTAMKFVRDPGGTWLHEISIDRDKIAGGVYSGQYRIILLNTGTKDYSGPLVVYDRLEPAMSYTGTISVSKVIDRRELKSDLALIPYLGFLALAIDNFSVTSDAVSVKSSISNGVLGFESQALTLSPGEGLQIDFGFNLAMPL